MENESVSMKMEGRWVDRAKLYQHLLHLHNMQAITLDQYRTLYKQISSQDVENQVVAEETIAHLIGSL